MVSRIDEEMVSLRDVSIPAWAYGVCGPHQPPFDEHKYRMPLDSLAGKATGGALTFDPRTGESKVFEVEIPAALVAKWLEEVGEQLISQIEFFVYLAVRFDCCEALLNRLGIAWIDNEAARFVAIKGSSDSFSLLAT